MRPAGDPRNLLRVSPQNPRYFTDASGRAIYLTGSHTWFDVQDGGDEAFDYDGFLDFLAGHNHSFLRLWTWEGTRWVLPDSSDVSLSPLPYRRTGPGPATDGMPKFDLTQLDDGYFDRLRQRVVAARDRGLYVGVMLFQGFSVGRKTSARAATPWIYHPMHRDNNVNGIDGDPDGDGEGYAVHTLSDPAITRVQEAYVLRVLDTLRDMDSVIYEISNESHGGSTDWQYHMIRLIQEHEGRGGLSHPVWMSFAWDGIVGSGTDEDLFASPADAISPRGPKRIYRTDPPAADGSRVILSDTDHLWGLGGTAEWVWKSFLRGHHPVFMDPYRNTPHHPADEVDPAYDAVRIAMGQTRAVAERVDLLSLAPSDATSSTGYCLAHAGVEYLNYQPEPHTALKLDLRAGSYRAEWFRPETGTFLTSPVLAVPDGWVELVPPFDGPAVLHLLSTAVCDRPRPTPKRPQQAE